VTARPGDTPRRLPAAVPFSPSTLARGGTFDGRRVPDVTMPVLAAHLSERGEGPLSVRTGYFSVISMFSAPASTFSWTKLCCFPSTFAQTRIPNVPLLGAFWNVKLPSVSQRVHAIC